MKKEPNRSPEATEANRISKRDAVIGIYERLRSGARRLRGDTRQDDSRQEKSETSAPATTASTVADGAKSSPAQEPDTESTGTVGPRSEMEWNDLISHRIEEAMRNGAFDNLSNKGKPLPASHNPHVPEDRRMANDLLKNNGLAPQWIGDRNVMLHRIEAFRAKVCEASANYQRAWHATATDVEKRQQIAEQWNEELLNWQTEIQRLNRRIEVVNLQQPIARLEIFKLILDEELKRAGVTRKLA